MVFVNNNNEAPPVKTLLLDHLGLIAGMFDELRIGEIIDQEIEQDDKARIVSIGNAIKGMVLNGLGFVNTRLYLVPEFFEQKPTEKLIGPGIKPENLNDDILGRALDSLYEYGTTSLFSKIAIKACETLGLDTKFAHIDSSSFHVDGKYNSDDKEKENIVHIVKGILATTILN